MPLVINRFLSRALKWLELSDFISCIFVLLGCHIGFEFPKTECPQIQKVLENDFLFILGLINFASE